MTTRDIAYPNARYYQGPFGPLRDKISVTIGTDDYEPGFDFIITAGDAGDLTYVTLGGTEATETVAAGDTINVGNVPVLCSIIRGSSTVTSVVVGRP